MPEQTATSLKKAVIESLKRCRVSRIEAWRQASGTSESPETSRERLLVHLDGLEGRGLDSGIPLRYRPWRLWHFGEAPTAKALQFLVGDASTLYLQGDVGTGKTSLAAAILYAWRWSGGACSLDCPVDCGAGRPEYGRFLPAYEAAARLRNLDKCGSAMDAWGNAAFLVLDDIGANRATPHVTEQLLFLLQRRYDRMLKTVVTSNFDLDAVAVALGERAASRLQEGILIELTGVDRRAGSLLAPA